MKPQIIDRHTLDFLLFDVLNVEHILGKGRYEDHEVESISSVMDLAQKIAENDLWTHAEKSDAEEPYLDGDQVKIVPEAIAGLRVMRDAGFFAAHCDYELGGMQLPVVITHVCNGMLKGANIGTQSYMGLTRSAANALNAHASDDIKQRYMMPMLEGRFFGTMCLSEPDVGSSLADIRTQAIPQEDGNYSIIGNKMWISGGDHEAAENIVHLVLARAPDASPGVKGLSLFAVPKFKVKDDGSLGDKNGVAVAGVNHKMGYRGTSNCLLSFGEKEPAIGQLVGEPGCGLFAMFLMMNEARISVGIGAAMLANVAYRIAVDYAKERKQGRPLADPDPRKNPVPIIEHPDVRRMLLKQKAFSEGAIALCLYAGMLVDYETLAGDKEERQHYSDLLDVLTPVVKAWPAEFGLEANKLAIQVLGGYGYARDFPVERLYRDNRLNSIHEGTNGIQALDLLGRKLVMNDGRGLTALANEIRTSIDGLRAEAKVQSYSDTLLFLLKKLEVRAQQTSSLLAQGERVAALANASPYLNAFGHMVIGWLWLQQAVQALKALNSLEEGDEASFMRGKVSACQYFFEYELPEAEVWLQVSTNSPDVLVNLSEAGF